MSTVKIAIVVAIMATVGLSGCVEPKVPVGDDPGYQPKIAQVLDIYAEYVKASGKTVGVTKGVRDLDLNIKINRSRPYLTRAEVTQLIEQALREQAGVVVVHRDRKQIIFGLCRNADQRPVLWLSPK